MFFLPVKRAEWNNSRVDKNDANPNKSTTGKNIKKSPTLVVGWGYISKKKLCLVPWVMNLKCNLKSQYLSRALILGINAPPCAIVFLPQFLSSQIWPKVTSFYLWRGQVKPERSGVGWQFSPAKKKNNKQKKNSWRSPRSNDQAPKNLDAAVSQSKLQSRDWSNLTVLR